MDRKHCWLWEGLDVLLFDMVMRIDVCRLLVVKVKRDGAEWE